MKSLAVILMIVSGSATSFAKLCDDGAIPKLSCATPSGIGQASGYPIEMEVCENQLGKSLVFQIKDAGIIEESGVVEKPGSESHSVIYSSSSGRYVVEVVSEKSVVFAVVSAQGANMGVLQCR